MNNNEKLIFIDKKKRENSIIFSLGFRSIIFVFFIMWYPLRPLGFESIRFGFESIQNRNEAKVTSEREVGYYDNTKITALKNCTTVLSTSSLFLSYELSLSPH